MKVASQINAPTIRIISVLVSMLMPSFKLLKPLNSSMEVIIMPATQEIHGTHERRAL